jgi:hypothetical protein
MQPGTVHEFGLKFSSREKGSRKCGNEKVLPSMRGSSCRFVHILQYLAYQIPGSFNWGYSIVAHYLRGATSPQVTCSTKKIFSVSPNTSTMSKSEESTIEVKLFVDKEKRKVLFAESDKVFVDVLFSFLTMPLGTIVRLLGKQSKIGCLDEIYRSVEDLSPDYFRTKACRRMLLAPLNAASGHCARLKVNVDGSKPWAVYVCKDASCCAHADCAFSSVPDSICKCGKVMQYVGDMPEKDRNLAPSPAGGSTGAGVFVKGSYKFIITDDLIVAPSSTSLMMSLFGRFGVRDPAAIEQTITRLSSQKVCLICNYVFKFLEVHKSCDAF